MSFRSCTNYLTNFKVVYVTLQYNKQSMVQYLLSARMTVSQGTDNIHVSSCYSRFV